MLVVNRVGVVDVVEWLLLLLLLVATVLLPLLLMLLVLSDLHFCSQSVKSCG